MTPSPRSPGRFATTCWTHVLSARGDTPISREALSELCELYYDPVLFYLRRAGFDSADEARDLAHDFFAYLLSGKKLDHLEREKGRFRSYLLGALKHFLSHRHSQAGAQKRGAGASKVSLNETGAEARDQDAFEDHSSLPPDALFDQQWAKTVLDRALNTLESEWKTEGKAAEFQHLSPWLTGEAEQGEQSKLAEKLGIPVNTLKSTIHRMRRQFRKAVQSEVARTLDNPSNVDQEMAALFSALSSA